MIPGGRVVFAHLKLRADPIEADALDNSPTIKALGGLQRTTAARVSSDGLQQRLWPVAAGYNGLSFR